MTKPDTLTLNFENHPGKYITIPRKIGARRKTAINAAVNPAEQAGADEHGNILWRPRFDLNSGAFEALLQAATHEQAYWNLTDATGKPLPRTRAVIEDNAEYEDDFMQVAPRAYRFVMGLDDVGTPEEKKDAPLPPPPDDGSSSAPSTAPRKRGPRT